MPQAKVYQIERLKTKVRNSFEETRNSIQAQFNLEQAEFVNSKIPEIQAKTGANKLKEEMEALEKKNLELQEKCRGFMRKYAGVHKLKHDMHYRFDRDETITSKDIDNQVERFAEAHAGRIMKKSKTSKELVRLRQLEDRCLDSVVLTNDIEEAQTKVELLLKSRAPFILENYKPTIAMLEPPKAQADE